MHNLAVQILLRYSMMLDVVRLRTLVCDEHFVIALVCIDRGRSNTRVCIDTYQN